MKQEKLNDYIRTLDRLRNKIDDDEMLSIVKSNPIKAEFFEFAIAIIELDK